MGRKKYYREDAEADLINSCFSESLGWIDDKGNLTDAGLDVVNQYPSKKNKIHNFEGLL